MLSLSLKKTKHMDNENSNGWDPIDDGIPPKFIEHEFDWIFKQLLDEEQKEGPAVMAHTMLEFQFWGGNHCVKVTQFLN